MRTIWFCGENEEVLAQIAEALGEELVTREQFVELIVHNEVIEVLGRGLKDTIEDKSIFIDRLGFLGNLLHRNNIFALIVSPDVSLNDRKLIKDTYGNYIQVNLGNKDSLCDLALDERDESNILAKKIVEYLINQKIILGKGQEVYSKEEEEEIHRRLEELGYV